MLGGDDHDDGAAVYTLVVGEVEEPSEDGSGVRKTGRCFGVLSMVHGGRGGSTVLGGLEASSR